MLYTFEEGLKFLPYTKEEIGRIRAFVDSYKMDETNKGVDIRINVDSEELVLVTKRDSKPVLSHSLSVFRN